MKVERTTFITFYSFKGGVGRTMALVNIAYLLYKSGRKVLVVDADLEAPGLWSVTSLGYDRQHQGFVELVKEYKKRCDSSDYSKDQKVPDPWEYIAPVEFKIKPAKKKSEEYAPGGEIAIMPAGTKDREYEQKLHSIDFEELFKKYYGSLFFQEIKERIRHSEHYDYVLIDSRTGFSDSGDICTHELCDHLIVLTGLNNQNLEGTKSFLDNWKKINNSIENEKYFALVASPIPLGCEEELKEERLKIAKEKLELDTEISLKIYYHARLALIEEPFVINWPESPISQSYQKISRGIREWGNDDVGDWVEKFNNVFKEKKYDEALSYLEELVILDQRNAIVTLRTLTYQFAPSNKDFLKSSLSYFELLNREEPGNYATIGNWGNALLNLGKKENNAKLVEKAIKKFQKVIELKPDDHQTYYNWGVALDDLGKMENNPKLLKEAGEKYKKAIELKPDSPDAYSNWGVALGDLGKMENNRELLKEAGEKYKKAIELKPDFPDAYSNWGVALNILGRMENNPDYYKQAIDILRKGERINPGVMSFNIACTYSLLNEPKSALKYLRKAIEYDPKLRQMALEEEDFASLRDNPEFIALVSPAE